MRGGGERGRWEGEEREPLDGRGRRESKMGGGGVTECVVLHEFIETGYWGTWCSIAGSVLQYAVTGC